uniref:Eukaryotic translation initiation factor 5B n=1 Tax=Solanum lycopersicum TaxID=4081 RepID=A0A3Q7FKF3_SOLLC
MGRKKATEENSEPPKQGGGGGGKTKKKNRVIDDDEYSVQTEEPTLQEDTVLDDDERKKPAKQVGGGGVKSRKKNVVIDDDEYTIATEEPVILEEKVILGGQKKAKKGKKGASNYGGYLTRDSDQEDEGIAPFTGKLNKSKQGKTSAGVFSTAFDTIGDEESEEDEEPVLAGMGKTSGNSFSVALLDEEEEADTSVSKFDTETVEEDDAPELIFAGKKKSSKKKKKSAVTEANVKEEAESEQASPGVNPEEEANDNDKKKQQRDVPETSKNKTKKKKGGRTVQEDEDEIDKILAELGEEAAPVPSEEKVHAQLESKDNKSKKKKGGRMAQEEDDIDKILAEIGEGPPATSAPTPSLAQEVKGQLQPQLGDAAAEKEATEEGAMDWDDADLKLPGKSAFEDEEVDSELQPITKKEIKVVSSAVHGAAILPVASKSVIPIQKTAATVPGVLKNDRSRKGEPEARGAEQNKQKDSPEEPGAPNQDEDNLRSPICCIMGHVDTGKTKLLDCIRGTNVQEGEAGGITQQIGATYFPAENIRERTKELKADAKLKVPGLLVIDTPGHESFTNLRSRGSGLCDIAILVVDIMHGLEPQTIESLNLLKMRNTEFIVALNKVDRLYGWKVCKNAPIVKAMKQQSKDVQFEFNTRLTQIVTQFKEQGINTELYYKNKEMGKDTFSIVPTSAISGEGIPDMLLLLVQWTQKTMIERLTYSNEVQCTVLEVKVVEGHGTTIDVVLVNGVLHEGDQIVVCGMQAWKSPFYVHYLSLGPIVTSIRALLTPHPMKELRVKGTYLHHKKIKAAQGIKITAQGFEHAIAGTSLYVVGPDDDVEDIKEAAMEDMKSVMSRIDKSGEGVYVQASTLGSLEALLEFLKTPEVSIPVSGIGIGPVHKKDVMKASVMLEKKKEYATILAFDVKVTQEARELSDELGVKVFMADIIYHLFDQFKAYIDTIKEEKKKEVAEEAVFPCVLKIVPNCVFNKKDPIVLGVDVLEGIVRIGSPICIPQKEFIDIGRIASIENNHKPVDSAKKGQRVAIKIVGSNPEEQQKMFGRHFEMEDELVSKISRRSIDILKANFRKDLSVEDWRLVMKLKTLFKIQ